MTNFQKLRAHLKTIRTHRKHVRKMCFKMGIPWRGLVHDLSKYSLKELSIAKYYTGTRSPHAVCRDKIGYSPSWNHHYHRNKHHFEYWYDNDSAGNIIQVKMPFKYLTEAFCDIVGASKAYLKSNYTQESPYNYYINNSKELNCMHNASKYLLSKLLWNLKEMGEKEFLRWFKDNKKFIKNAYDTNTLE